MILPHQMLSMVVFSGADDPFLGSPSRDGAGVGLPALPRDRFVPLVTNMRSLFENQVAHMIRAAQAAYIRKLIAFTK